MKKIILTSTVLLTSFALVLCGLFLPNIAFSWQNRQIQETVKQEEMEQITFSWSTGLLDTMRLISSNRYNLTPASEGNYDTSGIIDILTDYVRLLYEYKLMTIYPTEVIEESIDFELYYAVESTDTDDQDLTDSESEELLSAKVYFGSVILSNDIEFNFIIDDQTGKVARFSYYPTYSYENIDPSSATDSDRSLVLSEDHEYYAEQLTAFFEDYYEFTVLGYESLLADYSIEYPYYFEISESDDTPALSIYIVLYYDMVTFNEE